MVMIYNAPPNLCWLYLHVMVYARADHLIMMFKIDNLSLLVIQLVGVIPLKYFVIGQTTCS